MEDHAVRESENVDSHPRAQDDPGSKTTRTENDLGAKSLESSGKGRIEKPLLLH
jgi:hypothetical protein